MKFIVSIAACVLLAGCNREAPLDPYLSVPGAHHLQEEHGLKIAYEKPADILLIKSAGGVVRAEITPTGLARIQPQYQAALKAGWPSGDISPAEFDSALGLFDGALDPNEHH